MAVFPFHTFHYAQVQLIFIQMLDGNKMVLLLLEEMDKAMESFNSQTHVVCMLMMIKISMSLINQITVL